MKKTKLIKTGKTYQQRKAEARDEAIQWQAEFPDHKYSWGELAAWQEYFRSQGKKYGLLEEFQREGIC